MLFSVKCCVVLIVNNVGGAVAAAVADIRPAVSIYGHKWGEPLGKHAEQSTPAVAPVQGAAASTA